MRLLVLTHSYPPSRHANAKRPAYLVKGFLSAGWEVDVFTTWLGVPAGAQEMPAQKGLRIFRKKVFTQELVSKFARHRWLHRAVGLIMEGTSWPDTFYKWVLDSIGESRQLGSYDRVLAFVLPASMMLAGLRKGRVGRDWIFDYQESITPMFRRRGRRSPLQSTLLPVLEKLERKTLHQAGRVIFTAESNRRTYVESGLVQEQRTAHVPYFFDAELFNQPAPALSPKFQIVYFGTFDWTGARSPETFLRALRKFLEHHPEARSTTEFLFYGTWLSEHDRFIHELGLQDVVTIQPSIGYAEYIEKLRASPILLLVVAAAHNLFMPSKIVDYFGARRPIMAFVPKGSEMAQVLQNAGMADFSSEEFDVEGGASALERLWSQYQEQKLSVDSTRTHFWSSEIQVPRFIELVRRSTESQG